MPRPGGGTPALVTTYIETGSTRTKKARTNASRRTSVRTVVSARLTLKQLSRHRKRHRTTTTFLLTRRTMRTSLKTCFKCGQILPLSSFYRHSCMSDGHLNKCIECTKTDVRERYYDLESRKKVREYEHWRFQTTHRKAKVVEYTRRRRARNPEKHRAYQLIRREIKTGRLIRQPCEVCGESNAQAHHANYSRPLDVQWLCFYHHRTIGHGQLVG